MRPESSHLHRTDSGQMALFGNPPRCLEAQFWEFHLANPQVFRRLRDLALHMRRRGVRQYSIKGLFEVLRWNYALQTEDPASDFKLNNSFTSFYARLLNQDPELRGMFEMRTQRWQRHWR